MSQPNSPQDALKRPVKRVASHPWVEPLARFGYAAKGLVYFIIGLLAAQAAAGPGGRTTDTEGALQTIMTQPFGQVLLGIVAIGLVGYALWRFVQALLDPLHSHEETDAKRIVQRLGYAFSGLAYGGLAITAVKLIAGAASAASGNGDTSNAPQDWTALLMDQPFGRWLVGLGGLLTIGLGLSYLYQAYKLKFRDEFKLNEMTTTERRWTTRLGRFGIAARGVVFGVIGIFLIVAAWKFDPSEAIGLGGALQALSEQPFGPWLLGAVAFGLIAYGIYSGLEARYRRIEPS
ncbi:hypothetical protein C7B61_06200 [filamentous cyanobacterium CCP1]|nr:hypothetical protein C7B76_23295 [filamentous cyanobacterium CCP2]PSB67434.1 hypothetical protein C7B61_06200 [filamentous cyanobacterium CCP1]